MAIDDPAQRTDPSDRTPDTTAPASPDPAPDTTAPTANTAPTSLWGALRPLVLRLHFYAGLLIAPLLLVAATTGFLYSLSYQAEKVIYRHELRAPVGDRTVPLSDQLDAARTAHPEGTVTSVRLPSEEGATTRVLMSTPDSEEFTSLAVFVDPYTAEVRGALTSYGSSGALPVRAWLSETHRHLQLGEPGRLYSELAASWLWVVALGGLLLWTARKRASKRALVVPERGATGRRRTLSLHGSFGMVAVTGLVLLSATGLTWSAYAGGNITAIKDQLGSATPAVSATLDSDSDSGTGTGGTGSDTGGAHEGHESMEDMPGMEGMEGMHGKGGTDVGVDLAVVAARQAGLDGPIAVTLPTTGKGYVVAQTDNQFPARLDSVSVDPANGMVMDELRFADYPVLAQLTRIGIDAHMGLFLGLPNQLLLAALALALILLIVWGYRMWWLRRPTRERRLSAGRPVPRGAWRKVPLRLLLPLGAVTALIGWFLPLLGISLLVFLALDGALGLRARARAART
ncbi:MULTISPECIES: PepSY-associated TM helix domain-containing protein [unclassified Streptomyces]|uniref:PepSY-associated TM helix domain-containing protein n=1 Tax=unclassified Streptomyces TaxID=2593676 RepID=UPI00380A9F83